MTDLDKLVVADVGHGNCSIILTEAGAIVIDAACGSTVKDILRFFNEKTVIAVIVSHADADHIGGITPLLLDQEFTVKEIYLNADSVKKTRTFQEFRRALRFARITYGTRVFPSVDSQSSSLISTKNCRLEVLGPDPDMVVTGVGSEDLGNRPMDANSMSIVLRLHHCDKPVAILAGDMDAIAFENIKLEKSNQLKASILVFPHHGGLAKKADGRAFALDVSTCIEPDLVFFSNGRERFNNPRKEIVHAVVEGSGAHVACTQLCKSCSVENPRELLSHWGIPGRGYARKHSCAGSTVIEFENGEANIQPFVEEHNRYISAFPDRLCNVLDR